MDALKNNRGFSIIELIIAMAIAAVTMSAVVVATLGYESSVVGAETNAEAVTLAQKMLEHQQALSKQDFNLVNPTTTTITVGPLAYTTSVTVELQPDFLVNIFCSLLQTVSIVLKIRVTF